MSCVYAALLSLGSGRSNSLSGPFPPLSALTAQISRVHFLGGVSKVASCSPISCEDAFLALADWSRHRLCVVVRDGLGSLHRAGGRTASPLSWMDGSQICSDGEQPKDGISSHRGDFSARARQTLRVQIDSI